ncbi:MAG: hypothetical protein ACLFR1_02850 [Spirochaetia bacterium]
MMIKQCLKFVYILVLVSLVVSCGDLLMLLGFPGANVSLVMRIEHEGEWHGRAAEATYYTDEDIARTEPDENAAVQEISGIGLEDYEFGLSRNWFFLEAEKADSGTEMLRIEFISRNNDSGEETVIDFQETVLPGERVSMTLYTGNYDFVNNEHLE